eukprot:TRINITY_DN9200_c0_g1_i3.p1 TRINITY_DN9200_c0_g1~~TRINITY_DN9200_c0_g1_i3.p1  ORF type:complete len:469 (+),score=41.87 TRINITY_DN9200_c0_g1_i3:157-1407(+)
MGGAWLLHYLSGVRRVILHFGRGGNPGSSKPLQASHQRVKRIVGQCPALSAVYWPTWYAYTASMQGMLLGLKEVRARFLAASPYEREVFTLSDGCRIALDWIDPELACENLSGHARSKGALEGLPVCVIQHGAFQDSASATMVDLGVSLARRGMPVVVLNRRGYGGLDIGDETGARVDLYGFDQDLEEVLARSVTHRYPGRSVSIIGFSCGSGAASRYVGSKSAALSAWTSSSAGNSCKHSGMPRMLCAVLFDPGYDVSWDGAVSRIKFPYSWAINLNIKYCYAFRHRGKLRMKSQSFSERVDAVLSPVTGLRETYRQATKLSGIKGSSAWLDEQQPKLDGIHVPTLAINSRDDPICVWANVENFRSDIAANPHVILAELQRGSHGCKYGFWGLEPVTNSMIGEFIIASWRELCSR